MTKIADTLVHAERIAKLMADPQPGLFSWCDFFFKAGEAFVSAWTDGERNEEPGVVVKFPMTWGDDDKRMVHLRDEAAKKWGAVIFIPADVERPEIGIFWRGKIIDLSLPESCGVEPTPGTLDASESVQRSHTAVAISIISFLVSLWSFGFTLWVKFS